MHYVTFGVRLYARIICLPFCLHFVLHKVYTLSKVGLPLPCLALRQYSVKSNNNSSIKQDTVHACWFANTVLRTPWWSISQTTPWIIYIKIVSLNEAVQPLPASKAWQSNISPGGSKNTGAWDGQIQAKLPLLINHITTKGIEWGGIDAWKTRTHTHKHTHS